MKSAKSILYILSRLLPITKFIHRIKGEYLHTYSSETATLSTSVYLDSNDVYKTIVHVLQKGSMVIYNIEGR